MKFLFKRISVCILAFCFCLGVFFIPVAAASDDLHSYIYLDFDNLGFFTGTGEFTIYGDRNITSNIIYVLASEDPGTFLSGYVDPGGNTVTVERVWKNSSIACYKVKSNTAASFNHTFKLSASYSGGSYGIFNVYRVFTVGAAGISSLDHTGGNITIRQGDNYDFVETSERLNEIPLEYSISPLYIMEDMILDITFPISKFVGFDQVMFDAGFWDFNHDTSLEYLPASITSCSVLYNGAPLLISSALVDVGGDTSYDDIFTTPSSSYLINYGRASIVFDVPEQISENGIITFRFFYNGSDGSIDEGHGLTFYFHDLFGRFSFVKSEYELLIDISKDLANLDFDTADLEVAVNSLKSVLHSDLSSIESGIAESNSFLESIRNNLVNFRTNVGNWFTQLGTNISNGFANVGTWFSDLGSNISSLFSEWGQNIVDAIVSTNDNAADDFVDKSEDQSSDISDSMDKIDEIVTPDIDDIINPTLPPVDPGNPSDPTDPNAPTEDPASKPVEVLDPETVGSFAGVFGVFFENGMFSSIFSFVLLMMLASYVLFGKK